MASRRDRVRLVWPNHLTEQEGRSCGRWRRPCVPLRSGTSPCSRSRASVPARRARCAPRLSQSEAAVWPGASPRCSPRLDRVIAEGVWGVRRRRDAACRPERVTPCESVPGAWCLVPGDVAEQRRPGLVPSGPGAGAGGPCRRRTVKLYGPTSGQRIGAEAPSSDDFSSPVATASCTCSTRHAA